MRFETSVVINAPADLIWTTMIDVESWPQSTASITSAVRLDAGPFQLGSRARIKQPKVPQMVWTVTEFEPLRQFTWTVNPAGVTTIARHILTPGPGQSTTVTLSIDRVGMLAAVVDLLTAGLTKRYIAMEAEGLKRVCETESVAAAA